MIKIKRALISVTDKSNLDSLVRVLYREGVEILSTGGTKKYIEKLGLPVQEVSEYIDFPEILGGRVKTLHPKVFGGILFNRSKPSHSKELIKSNIKEIDLVVVNLYKFEDVLGDPNLTHERAIENIDIGGVALLRASAKNSNDVVVLSNVDQYKDFVQLYNKYDGNIPRSISERFAEEAFSITSHYDALISNYFKYNRRDVVAETTSDIPLEILPEKLFDIYQRDETLRYGENPHQKAALYKRVGDLEEKPKKLHGKQLSYNNLIDIDAAYRLVDEFKDEICIAIIKHTNPCGVAVSKTSLSDAYTKARESDPISFFGGIVASTKEIDEMTASLISESFLEAVIAPKFSDEAFSILSKKKNIRLLEYNPKNFNSSIVMRDTIFGLVTQEHDNTKEQEELVQKTDLDDSTIDLDTLKFAIKVCKHVKSNAIVLAKDLATVGVGAGQMSRVDSLKAAISKASGRASDSVMASDAFFPFSDCVEIAGEVKISAIAQPGGSIKDKDSIEMADKLKIPMYFTGVRHFRH